MPTVATAGFAAALISLGLVVIGAAAQVSAHQQARVAADLAAVAAAHAHARGENTCAVAGQVAGHNGAALSGCVVTGADVTITARIGRREVSSTAGPV
ncbi:TadE-like protein [Corynebacterium hylobatis]|uniref:TadE-like protein n=1 Tax=Corynebacterium hylobatis TaxID=1859290 RepID=A0A3S0C255_9CORY|nr:Rv3654c family TadE-like protein [Corynebacterium hylobatis]RSZ64428.1 TadE-like protein [Corynebacterium hylobatis]